MKNLIMTLILALFATGSVLAEPTDKTDAEDVYDVNQTKRDGKIWQNILKQYAAFRGKQQEALKILDNVMEWAWNANAYINAIQTLAERGEQVIESLKTFDFENDNIFKTFIETVEFLEEDVFQQTDIMLTFDVANMQASRARLLESTKKLKFWNNDADAVKTRNAIEKELKDVREYNLRYYTTLEASALKPAYAQEFGHLPEVKRHMISVNTAAEGIAAQGTRDDKYYIDEVITNEIINNINVADGSTENISMLEQATAKLRLSQNSLITTTSTHEIVRDGTMTMGMMVLNEAAKIETSLLARGFFIYGIERFSEELNANYELVNGKWKKKQ